MLPTTSMNLFVACHGLSGEVSKTAQRGQIELLKFYRRPLQLYEAFFDDLVEAFAAWTCA